MSHTYLAVSLSSSRVRYADTLASRSVGARYALVRLVLVVEIFWQLACKFSSVVVSKVPRTNARVHYGISPSKPHFYYILPRTS